MVSPWIFGVGDLAVLSNEGLQILPAEEVLPRFLQAFGVAFAALYTVACLSVTLSCFADNSIGPIVGTMAIIMVFTLVGTLDVALFDQIRPFCLPPTWRPGGPCFWTRFLGGYSLFHGSVGCSLGFADWRGPVDL